MTCSHDAVWFGGRGVLDEMGISLVILLVTSCVSFHLDK